MSNISRPGAADYKRLNDANMMFYSNSPERVVVRHVSILNRVDGAYSPMCSQCSGTTRDAAFPARLIKKTSVFFRINPKSQHYKASHMFSDSFFEKKIVQIRHCEVGGE